MISVQDVHTFISSFSNVDVQPHFEKTSFRIKKRIFATLDETNMRVVVKLSELQQSLFCAFDNEIIYPVKGAWGTQGWTVVELSTAPRETLYDALKMAYSEVAAKK